MRADPDFPDPVNIPYIQDQINGVIIPFLPNQPFRSSGAVCQAFLWQALNPSLNRRTGNATPTGGFTNRAQLLKYLYPGLPGFLLLLFFSHRPKSKKGCSFMVNSIELPTS